ncbi:D-alanine--D-alanyl carrier protein ligase [Streptomyces badius]
MTVNRPARKIEDILPLSPLQEGLLFHSLFDETAADIYTAQLVVELEGVVDPAAMRAATAALLRRHVGLRAAFRQRKTGEWARAADRHAGHHAHLRPPAHAAGLLSDPRHRPGVLMLGGEGASEALWTEINATPDTTGYNFYGPTECTVDTLSCRTADYARPAVGRPLRNVRAYVLDAALQPVPVGVPGELYLGGPQLARGYLGRPALTAERFVADPFGPPGGRLYRTGDVVCRLPEGDLEYHGRADDQVKIRGFRIEPGEVEAAVATHPEVAEAVVIARDEGAVGTRLVAYVVPTAGARLDTALLRKRLAAELPDYMVPAAITVLEELPLTANGKLDRRALPAPDYGPVTIGRGPRSPREEVLCGLFAEVLRLPRVGIDDNFFELGGDSILSIQLVSRTRRAGFSLSVRQVFENRTVAELAEVVDEAGEKQAEPGDDGVGLVPLTPIAHELLAAGGAWQQYNQALAIQVPATLAPDHAVAALQTVLDHHDALRLRLRDDDRDRPVQEIAAAGSVRADHCLVRVDAAGLDDDAVRRLMAERGLAAREQLAPSEGRMVRLVWLDRGRDRPGMLLWVLHHLVVDGVSWRVLLPDFAEAFEAVAAGRRPALQPVGTSFRRWAQRLVDLAGGPGPAGRAAYWTRTLQGAEPPLGEWRSDPALDTYATAGALQPRLGQGEFLGGAVGGRRLRRLRGLDVLDQPLLRLCLGGDDHGLPLPLRLLHGAQLLDGLLLLGDRTVHGDPFADDLGDVPLLRLDLLLGGDPRQFGLPLAADDLEHAVLFDALVLHGDDPLAVLRGDGDLAGLVLALHAELLLGAQEGGLCAQPLLLHHPRRLGLLAGPAGLDLPLLLDLGVGLPALQLQDGLARVDVPGDLLLLPALRLVGAHVLHGRQLGDLPDALRVEHVARVQLGERRLLQVVDRRVLQVVPVEVDADDLDDPVPQFLALGVEVGEAEPCEPARLLPGRLREPVHSPSSSLGALPRRGAGHADKFLVETGNRPRGPSDVEGRPGVPQGPAGDRLAQIRIGEQGGQRRGQGRRILRDQTVVLVAGRQALPRAVHIGQHDGASAGHRLQRGQRHAFPAGGQHEDVRRVDPRPYVLAGSGEQHTRRGRFRKAVPVGPVAHQDQPCPGSAIRRQARSRMSWPFCRVRRPTQTTSGASGSVPCRRGGWRGPPPGPCGQRGGTGRGRCRCG